MSLVVKILLLVVLVMFIFRYINKDISEPYYPNPLNWGINSYNNKVCMI